MRSLNGNLIRISGEILKITLNKEVTGTLYYSEKLDGELKFIKHIEKENEFEFKDPEPKNRTFYFIKCENEELILAERLVPLERFCNFRHSGHSLLNRTIPIIIFCIKFSVSPINYIL
ncbi:MAG: hypothetical protein E7J47_03745 [Clostridium perfringens]|nr:hypothetical protein [Clostridium perfringens]